MIIKLQFALGDAIWADGKLIREANQPIGFYFEIQADGNYETLATSEIYETHRSAMEAIGLIVGTRLDVEVVDETA